MIFFGKLPTSGDGHQSSSIHEWQFTTRPSIFCLDLRLLDGQSSPCSIHQVELSRLRLGWSSLTPPVRYVDHSPLNSLFKKPTELNRNHHGKCLHFAWFTSVGSSHTSIPMDRALFRWVKWIAAAPASVAAWRWRWEPATATTGPKRPRCMGCGPACHPMGTPPV